MCKFILNFINKLRRRRMRDIDVDKARVIAPTNHVPKVVEINSNFTAYIAELNPETAGGNNQPESCGSTSEVAEKFKPTLKFQVKKLNNIGSEEIKEEETEIIMNYGEDPKEIMKDFTPDNIVVKAKHESGEKVLLDQQLTYTALEDFQERLKDKKFAQMVKDNKDGLLAALEQEIERINKLKEEIELDKQMEE